MFGRQARRQERADTGTDQKRAEDDRQRVDRWTKEKNEPPQQADLDKHEAETEAGKVEHPPTTAGTFQPLRRHKINGRTRNAATQVPTTTSRCAGDNRPVFKFALLGKLKSFMKSAGLSM